MKGGFFGKKIKKNENQFRLVFSNWIDGVLVKIEKLFNNVGDARKFIDDNCHEGNAKIYHPNGQLIYLEEKHRKHHLKHDDCDDLYN